MTDDLHWLAFRYVSREMTADEEAAFEQRLADDQNAREAVAEAVELSEAVRLAVAEPVSSRPHPRFARRRPVVWLATLAACVLVAVGLFWLASLSLQRPDTAARQDAPAAADVALTWAQMQHQRAREDLAPEAPQRPPVPEDAVEEVMGGEVGVPQWLLIAFAAEAKRTKERP